MPSPEIRAVAENLISALRFFGYARGTGEIRDLPGLSLITCGLNYAAFNAALLSKPIESDARELSQLIEVSAGQFGARNLRWTCWICEDFLGKPLRREAGQIFSRHGLRPLTEAPGMYAERLRPPQRRRPLTRRVMSQLPLRRAAASRCATWRWSCSRTAARPTAPITTTARGL